MNDVFSSNFKKDIENLIEQKQATGFSYVASQHSLKEFDRFCQTHYPKETQLTREVAMHWAERQPNEHLRTLSSRISPYVNWLNI